jgi:cytoskeletal protein RodZ
VSDFRPPFDDYPRGADETERFATVDTPSPWYLKRWVLALWSLAVAILLAVIIWGLAILARGNGGGAPAPKPTHTSTTTSSTTTTPSTTTTTTEETIEPSESSTPAWTPQHPRRHHWHGNLPPIPPIPAIPHF